MLSMQDQFSIQRISRWTNISTDALYKKCEKDTNWCFWIGRLDANMRYGKTEIVINDGIDSLYTSAFDIEQFHKIKESFKDFLNTIKSDKLKIIEIEEQKYYIGALIRIGEE